MYIQTAERRNLHAGSIWMPFFLVFLQLLSHIEKLRTSMIDDLNASNVFSPFKILTKEVSLYFCDPVVTRFFSVSLFLTASSVVFSFQSG